MKFVWPPEYEEELHLAGYQKGYEAMHEIAVQALNGYYSLVFNIIQTHNAQTQHLDLGAVPPIEDPKLAGYLDGVLFQVMLAYQMSKDAKTRITELEASLIAKDKELEGLKADSEQARRKLDQEKAKSACASETKLKETLDDHALSVSDAGKIEHFVANLYGMIHPSASDTFTVRSVFVIGPDKKLKLTLTYPASTGRNFDEIFRVVESLQLTAKYSVATPADWKPGQDCIISPSVPDSDVAAKFPKGHKTIKPYLRTTPQPNL